MSSTTIGRTDFASEAEPLWWPGLASQLASRKWVELNTNSGLTDHSYSTTRFVLGEAHKPRLLMSIDGLRHTGIYLPPKIEVLPALLEDGFAKHGLHFYGTDEVQHSAFSQALRAAFEQIRIVPDLFETVLTLAKSVVLLRPEDEVSDVSYSSPEIPFSIFVSLPQAQVPHLSVRVAEAVIHECMHLQLTLLEEAVPLLRSDAERHFSPWKRELRNSSGVLHALYVFAVIKGWLQALPLDECSAHYVPERVSQIAREASQLRNFESSMDLTTFGRAICRRLLNHLRADDADAIL